MMVKANTIKLLSLTITYPRDDVSPLKIYANLSNVSNTVTPTSNTPRSILFLNAKALVINASTARQRAIAEIEPMWLTQDSKLKIVPGKQVMSDLSRKCQEQFKVSFNPQQIGNEMNADEIAQEMVETLKAIRQCR